MRVLVDADSCPRRVREIIVRASRRTGVSAVFVANREVPGIDPASKDFVRVPRGEGSADRYILEQGRSGDIVVTRDIPLASDLVERGICVLNDRGVVYSRENVRERLSLRNFMYHLRHSGVTPPPGTSFGAREGNSFANSFDRELSRLLREAGTG